jgi:hypothetical protein
MSSDIFDIVAAENDPLTVFSLQDEATQDRIRDSLRLSATLDVPPSQVYADYDIYKEEVNRRNLSPIEKVWPNFKAGVGDVITATGTVLKLMGEEDAGGDLIEYGNRLSMSYIPMAEEREFSWFNMLNTDYLATHLTRSVPFTLSLIPLGLVGFYGGEAVATRLALGAFGRTVLRGIGATALSRPIESAFEAAQTYQDALTKGMSDDEARQAAEFTFKANLALAATDVSEIATAFMPIKLPAKVAGNVLLKRAAAALPVKLLGVAGMEAGEEAIQEAIQRKALGEDIKLDPQMTEAMALGAVFGLGLGGAGSVYTVLTGRVKKQMSQQQRDALEDRVDELQADGMDEQQATIKALDEFTETEEGQQLVETVMQDIVDTVEGKKEPAEIEEPTVAEITKEQPVEERATAKEPWQMTRPEFEKQPTYYHGTTNTALTIDKVNPRKAIETEGAVFFTTNEDIASQFTLPREYGEIIYEYPTGEFDEFGAEIYQEITPGPILETKLWLKKPLIIEGDKAQEIINDTVLQGQIIKKAQKEGYDSVILKDVSEFADPIAKGDVVAVLDQKSIIYDHRQLIKQALAEGKPVPEEVLKDYPDLAEKYGKQAELPIKPEQKEPWQMTRPEETFKQELETVRKLAETEPAFQPFPHGLGGGFKNIEIAKAIEKAQKNKKLNEREKRIYLAALETANEKLTEQIANTPDIDIEDYIDNALTRMMQEHYSKADQEKFIVSQIKKAVEKAGGGKQIITDEAVLLRMRLRAEARGAKLAEAETRKLMQKQHKLHMKMLKAARIEVAKFIRENLPQSKRGRFLSAVANEMNLVKQKSIIETVNKIAETVTKNKIIKEIKRLAHPPKTVELGYRKRIKALLEDVSLDKFTQKTIDKATELKKFIEANPNINIPDYHLKKLAAVTKKPLTGLTTQELLTLKEELVRLTALGKLKAKLLKYAGEAKIQRERAKLLASTKNIDPKVPTGTDDISRQRKLFKESALWYYLQTLTPLRVADMFDGFKNFTGEHARWMKDIANRETSALYTAKTDEVSAYSEMLKSGVKSVSEDRQIAMAINIYHQMGAYDQVKTLLEKHGMKEIPEITVKEQEIINIMRRYLNANVEDIAALAEERRNEPFVKVENYFPLKYENDPHNVEIDNLVKQTRRFNKHSVKQDFVYERVKGVKLIPRTDIFSVFSEALNEQQYFLKVQPMLDDIKTIVQSKEFLEKAGDFVTRWWLKQIDIMARRGWSAQGKANPALRQIRINLSRAVLGYKLSSVLMQPFAIFDAMAYMQAKYGTGAAMKILGEFTKAWVNPRLAEQYANVTPVLAVRETGEPVMAELEAAADRLGSPKGIVNVYLRNSMRLLQKADLITAAGVRKGILKVLEERGIPNAETEADIITNLVSASAEVAYRPQILAEGDFAKLWFAFQNFFLNRWGIIAHDIIGSAVKGEMQSKLTSAFALAVFVTGGMLEDWAREKLFEFTTGKEIPDRNPLLEGFMSIPSNIPYFGQFFYAMMTGLEADPPAVRVLGNIFKGGRKLIAGKKPETKGKGALNILESTAILFPGIPGTAQFADFIEGTIFRPVKKSDSNVKFKKVEI